MKNRLNLVLKIMLIISFGIIEVNAQVVGTPFLTLPNNDTKNPLDRVSVAPGGAYSVRKLKAAYSGSCMKVRRSSDNTLQDIGFDADGNLNTTALLSFVGTGSGFVQTWYDQSGNSKNLVQNTNAYQPRIVNAGALDKENEKPFIRFFGITQPSTFYNSLDLPSEQTTTAQVVIINKFDSGTNFDGFLLGSTTYFHWHSDPTPNNSKLFANFSTSIWNATIYQNRVQKFNGNATLYPIFNTSLMVNSVAPQTPETNTTWNCIGRDRTYHPITGGGGYGELYFFTTAISDSERLSLELSAMSYFRIY